MSKFRLLLRRTGLALLMFVGLPLAVRAAEPPPAPVGLDVDGISYALISNNLWKVTNSSGAQTPARQVILRQAKSPTGRSAYERQDKAFVWARTCTGAKDHLVFRRKLFMPGPAKTFGAQFEPTFYGSISLVEVLINGAPALSSTNGYVNVPEARDRKAAKLFKYGDNDIEVHVYKRAKGKFQGYCTSGSPPKPLGIYFNLYGTFETNVAVSTKATGTGGSTHTYVTVDATSAGAVVTFNDRYRPLLNLGPSGLYRGTLIIQLNGGSNTTKMEVGEVAILGAQLKNCQETTLHIRHWRLVCDVLRWPKTAKPSVTFTVHVGLPTGEDSPKTFDLFGEAHLYARTSDPNLKNNDDYLQLTICRPDAPDPKCPD